LTAEPQRRVHVCPGRDLLAPNGFNSIKILVSEKLAKPINPVSATHACMCMCVCVCVFCVFVCVCVYEFVCVFVRARVYISVHACVY
jgi:hypothetical protein